MLQNDPFLLPQMAVKSSFSHNHPSHHPGENLWFVSIQSHPIKLAKTIDFLGHRLN